MLFMIVAVAADTCCKAVGIKLVLAIAFSYLDAGEKFYNWRRWKNSTCRFCQATRKSPTGSSSNVNSIITSALLKPKMLKNCPCCSIRWGGMASIFTTGWLSPRLITMMPLQDLKNISRTEYLSFCCENSFTRRSRK